jgi:ribosomal protein S18 acetylase RimI-like enzyme
MATTMLQELTPEEFLGELDALLAIYASAMNADSALLPGRRELMRRHVDYPSFEMLLARAEAESRFGEAGAQDAAAAPADGQDGQWPAVGFAYGFRGEHGQWWYDAVWTAISRTSGAATAQRWLADCMEVAEIHVHQRHQRAGIGTHMLLTLTSGRPERTAVLSTPDSETTARRLYRRLGFRDLLTSYSFPGGSPPYAVMGAVLPLIDAAGVADTAGTTYAGEVASDAARSRAARSASPSIW